MTEEDVTKTLIAWLQIKEWSIISYDFPQSGTGIKIRPANSKEKNKGVMIPDIIALKGSFMTFFENKPYLSQDDIKKVKKFKSVEYRVSIENLAALYGATQILYGIGFLYSEKLESLIFFDAELDFAVSVRSDKTVHVLFDSSEAF